MFATIEYLHDQSNTLISFLLYQTALNDAKFSKKISDRQFNLIQTLMIITVTQNNKFLLKLIYIVWHKYRLYIAAKWKEHFIEI